MIMEHSINAAVPRRTLSLLTLLVLSQPALAQYAATVSGTGVSGDTVYVFRDGVQVGLVPVVSREWTFHDSAPAGLHKFAWQLERRTIDDQRCEFTNHVRSRATEEFMNFLRQGNPLDMFRAQRAPMLIAHNKGETEFSGYNFMPFI
jgi:hypothetical protein